MQNHMLRCSDTGRLVSSWCRSFPGGIGQSSCLLSSLPHRDNHLHKDVDMWRDRVTQKGDLMVEKTDKENHFM